LEILANIQVVLNFEQIHDDHHARNFAKITFDFSLNVMQGNIAIAVDLFVIVL